MQDTSNSPCDIWKGSVILEGIRAIGELENNSTYLGFSLLNQQYNVGYEAIVEFPIGTRKITIYVQSLNLGLYKRPWYIRTIS